jgi:hypothetical protein
LFAFRDAGGNDVTNLVATLLNISGVTNASSPQNYGNLTSGGPSTNQLFSFTAVGTNGQQIAATFQLQGNGTNLGTALFAYTLGTWTTRFSSTNRIIINDFAPAPVPYMATPYPSIINVSSVGGVVIKATVTVTNLSHESLNDVNVLLVSPSEQDTLLMSHVGTPGVSASHITLTFDDAAANALSSTGAITSGTYKPTQYGAPPNFP